MSAITDLFATPRNTAPDALLLRLRAVTVGEYEIRGELGRGGMAVVFLAKDIRLDRSVAIKVMLPDLMRTEGMDERFLQEARISARLQHPNIIIVHDVRQREELIYFVMGLVDGCGLDEIVRAGTLLPIDDVRWVLMQAAQALGYANGEGIVHRDVKPGNILLTVKGDVLVTDFGIAKVVENNTTRSMGATIIGTPMYMSPEQVTGQRVSEASDQYSLGITAYALLAGTPPFSGDLNLYDLQTAHVRTRPVPLQTRRPDCPPALAAAVMRMLEKRPENRWPSLQSLGPVLAEGLPHDGLEIKRRLGAVATSMRNANVQRSRVLAIETPVTPRPGTSPRLKPATIVVSPPGATLHVAARLELTATVLTGGGDPIDGAIVAWTSSDTEVATITPSGVLLAVGPGAARIRAALGSVYEEALVTVALSPIVKLEYSPEPQNVLAGETLRPTVRAVDAQGRYREDAASSWLSRHPGIVKVVGAGELLGVAPGEAVVEVSAGTARATLRVLVTRRPAATVQVFVESSTIECGNAVALRVEAFDERGALVVAPRTTWSSGAPHIVHVDSAGTAIALSTGRATITAIVDGVSSALSLTVIEAPIAAIAMSVRPSALEPGDTAHVELVVTDAEGRPRSEDGITVASDNDAVVRVLGDGRTLTAVAPGDARIVARVDDPILAAAVAVTPVPITVRLPVVHRVLLSSPSLELVAGAMVAVTARCQDARRRVLTDAIVSWQSLDPSVVAVDARGQFRALSAGETIVRVTAVGAHESSVTVEVPVRVLVASVASVQLSASSARMMVGTSQALQVVITDSTDAVVTDRTAAFGSSDPRIASVDASGVVTTLAPGQVTISAHVDGERADLVLFVDRTPLTGLRIVAPAGPVEVGDAVRCAVQASDASGETRDVGVAWSVVPAGAATVDADGTLRARRAGSFTLIADGGGVRDERTIEAVAPVVARVTPNGEQTVDHGGAARIRTVASAPTAELPGVVPPERKSPVRTVGVTAGVLVMAAIAVFVATRKPTAPAPSTDGSSAPAAATAPAAPTPPPAGIVIDYQLPQAGGLPVGSRLSLRALFRGGRVPVAGVRWSVSPDGAATIDREGVLLAQRPATVRVTATSPADSVAVASIAIVVKPDSTKPDAAPPPLAKGILVVSGLPAGGSVRVDRRRVSGTRIELAPGLYTVQLQAAGYDTVTTTAEIGAGETRLVFSAKRIELPSTPSVPGALNLRFRPHAKVFVDDVLVSEGKTQLFMTLPEGPHRLRFEKPGHLTLDTVFVVRRADTLSLLGIVLRPETP